MAIDREALKSQVDDNKARRAAVGVQYIKKDETRNLRVLEFENPDKPGSHLFSRTVVHFRVGDGKQTVLDRKSTFGAPCIGSKLYEQNRGSIQRRQTQYYINAIDLDKDENKVEIFALPTSVWEVIAGMVLSEEWADVLEPKAGHFFTIERTGSGLDTEYATTVSRKPYPVNKKLLQQAVDPYEKLVDPGLAGQAGAFNVSIEDVFDDPDSLEMVDPITGPESEEGKKAEGSASGGRKKKSKAKDEDENEDEDEEEEAPKTSKKKSTKKKSTKKPADSPWKKGVAVTVEIDGADYNGEITKAGKGECEVTFDDEDVMNVPVDQLKLAEAEEGDEEEEDEIPF